MNNIKITIVVSGGGDELNPSELRSAGFAVQNAYRDTVAKRYAEQAQKDAAMIAANQNPSLPKLNTKLV